MPQIPTYTEQTSGNIDGTELMVIDDGGTTFKLQLTTLRAYLLAQVVAGANVTVTPSGDTIIIASTGGGGGGLADGDYGDITVSGTGTVMNIDAGTITATELATDAVTTIKILDSNVTAAKLASDAVTTAKIVDANVTTAKLADDSITTVKIATDAVTTIKILDANVTTAKIADLNVTTTKIADLAVTAAKIANDTITGAQIAPEAITSSELADNAVDAAAIAADAVITAKILDANVTAAKLATDSVTTVKILDANVTTSKILDSNVTTAKIADANVTAVKLATDSVTTVKIVDENVTAAKLATDSVTTAKIQDGAVTSAKLSGSLASVEADIDALEDVLGLDTAFTGIDFTGATDSSAAFKTLLTTYTGKVLQLPEGTILYDHTVGGNHDFPAGGITIRGKGRGKTILKIKNPGSSNVRPFRLNSDTTLEDIDIIFDPTTPPQGASNACLYAASKSNLTFRRVRVHGPGLVQNIFWAGCGCVELFGCTNVRMEDCEIKYSQSTSFGLEILGGSDHVYTRCVINENAADGVKTHANNTYGEPVNIRFVECTMNENGQQTMQGQDAITGTTTVTVTPGSDLTVTNQSRYRLNYSVAGSLTLAANPSNPINTTILLSKVINSASVTLNPAAGETFSGVLTGTYVYGSAALGADDYRQLLFTKSTATNWLTSWHTNGEGFDGWGRDLAFIDCVTDGNADAGIQLKPLGTPCSARIVGCVASNSWAGNGFGIVHQTSSDPFGSYPNGGTAGVSFQGCTAHTNRRGTGFHIAADVPTFGVSMIGCTSRYNRYGIRIPSDCRNTVVDSCTIMGNGDASSPTVMYQILLEAAVGTRITNCLISGVDPIGELHVTEAAYLAATPRGKGILLYHTNGGVDMADTIIENNTFELHNAGSDFVFSGGNLTDYIGRCSLAGVHPIPLETLRVWDAVHTLLPSTAAADDLAIVGGTFGTNSVTIQTGDVDSLFTVTRHARFSARLPDDYVAGRQVWLRVHGGMKTNLADTTATVDFQVYESNLAEGVGSDLCATAAQSINSLTAGYDFFQVTSSGLSAGDVLDVRMTIETNDSATGAPVIGRINRIDLIC